MAEINPSVFISPEVSVPGVKKGLNSKFLVVVIVVIIAVLGLVALRSPSPKTGSTALREPLKISSKPRIILVADKKEYKVGDGVILLIGFGTGGKKTVGADVLLHFDTKMLEATSSTLFQGSLYSEYPLLSADQKSGVIRVSGISSAGSNFTGEGVLATAILKATKAGKTKVTVDFTPGSTTDSNIVGDSSADLLEEIGNLEVEIK